MYFTHNSTTQSSSIEWDLRTVLLKPCDKIEADSRRLMKILFSAAALTLSMLVIIASSTVASAQTINTTGDTIINSSTGNSISATSSVISANPANQDTSISYTISHDPSYARLFVNESKIAYVEYGGSATLRWESYKKSSCTLVPTGQTGLNGQYVLQNITRNMQVQITCLTSSGAISGRSADTGVYIKVLPPTFDYLRGYLSQLQYNNSKKVNLASTTVFIDQAQKAHNSGNTDLAQAFLQKSINNLKQLGVRADIATDSINQYEHAASYLSKTLSVSLAVAADGCSVAATGTEGFTVDYGSHELGLLGTIVVSIGIGPQYPIVHGYLAQTTIPSGGTVTESIPARSGWTTFGKVVDSDGLIYALRTVGVTTNCPSS